MVFEPNANERQQYKRTEGFGQLVVPRGDAAAFLDASDQPLDHVASFVLDLVEPLGTLRIRAVGQLTMRD